MDDYQAVNQALSSLHSQDIHFSVQVMYPGRQPVAIFDLNDAKVCAECGHFYKQGEEHKHKENTNG